MNTEQLRNTILGLLGEGQFLVDIQINASNNVKVYVDDMNGLSISECRRISKGITKVFSKDEHDYGLEVSSPGIDKPFKVVGQYQKYTNRVVEVLLTDGLKYEGVLKTVSDQGIKLEIEEKINKKEKQIILSDFKYSEIKKTNLKMEF
jgi:ribosome maturation factor RimP